MKISLIVLSSLVSVAALAGCASTAAEEETRTAEGEIIRFPTSAFANAQVIAYGQTVRNVPFKASAQFSTLKFSATAGDRVTGTVTASPGESIVYIVRKVGNDYVNVKAGGQDSASPNIVVHQIEATGDYYLVFRTVPRKDSTFTVSLAKAGAASGKCADAGTLPSLAMLSGAVGTGASPNWYSPVLYADIEQRECLYATGCGSVTQRFQETLPYNTYRAQKSGANFTVVAEVSRPGNQPNLSIDAQGNVTGMLTLTRVAGVQIPVSGSTGPTCKALEETFVKVPKSSAAYTEYRIVGIAPTVTPFPNNPHPAAAPLPAVPVLDPLSDEEALTKFPRGAGRLVFTRANLPAGVDAGQQRNCHPLTSCSSATPASVNPACRRVSNYIPGDLYVYSAKVVGPDSYALETNRGIVEINDGVGSFAGGILRVGESSLQIEFPAASDPRSGDMTYETSNSTCTYAFPWTGTGQP